MFAFGLGGDDRFGQGLAEDAVGVGASRELVLERQVFDCALRVQATELDQRIGVIVDANVQVGIDLRTDNQECRGLATALVSASGLAR